MYSYQYFLQSWQKENTLYYQTREVMLYFFLDELYILWQNWFYMIGDGGHLGNWQSCWNNSNIRIVLITITVHSTCSKYTIHYQNDLFRPYAAILRQKIGLQDSPCRPFWKLTAILKFCIFSLGVTPIKCVYKIWCLYYNLKEPFEICHYLPN